MYGWFFRHLPGPTWFRVFLCLVIAAFAGAVLFAFFYPGAELFFGLGGAADCLTENEHRGGGRHCRPPQCIQFSCLPFGRGREQTLCQSEAGLVSLSGLRGWGRPKSHPVTRRE